MHFDATYYNAHHQGASVRVRGELKAKCGGVEAFSPSNDLRAVLKQRANFIILYDELEKPGASQQPIIPKGKLMKDLLRRHFNRLLRILQWLITLLVIACAVLFLILAINFQDKGANASVMFGAVGIAASIAVLLSPPVLFKLPGKVRVLIYVLIVPAVIANLWSSMHVNETYKNTPKGLQEEKQYATAEAARVESERREVQMTSALEHAETDRANLAASKDKIAGCINWRGQVPALTEYIKTRLHNPRSFEHVQTRAIDLGEKVKIVMEYRGENGFGATRAESVVATISPEDCSVVEVVPF